MVEACQGKCILYAMVDSLHWFPYLALWGTSVKSGMEAVGKAEWIVLSRHVLAVIWDVVDLHVVKKPKLSLGIVEVMFDYYHIMFFNDLSYGIIVINLCSRNLVMIT